MMWEGGIASTLNGVEPTNYWKPGSIPFTPHYPYTLNYWSGSDSEENFKKNPKPGFTSTSIQYMFNNYGFRGPDFNLADPRDKILCFGCSITMGVGINYEETWVNKFEQFFPNSVAYNFGIGGTSGDTCARSVVNSVEFFKPKTIAILWPSLMRHETYTQHQIDLEGPWSMTRGNMKYFNEVHAANVRHRNKLIVNLVQQVHKFNLVELEVDFLPSSFKAMFPSDKIHHGARDNHPGPAWQTHIAETMYEEYKRKYDNSKV